MIHYKLLFKQLKTMRFKDKIFTLFIVLPTLICFTLIIKKVINKVEEKRRYRKIIKRGLLWDTEYLIEKDNYNGKDNI